MIPAGCGKKTVCPPSLLVVEANYMASRNGESVLGKIISAADLAALVGLSERHLRRLTKSGIVALGKNKAGRVLAGR